MDLITGLKFPTQSNNEKSIEIMTDFLKFYKKKFVKNDSIDSIGTNTALLQHLGQLYLMKKYTPKCMMHNLLSDSFVFVVKNNIIEIDVNFEVKIPDGYEMQTYNLNTNIELRTKIINHLKHCIINNKEQYVFMIPISFALFKNSESEGLYHANMLIYNRYYNTLQHFEPQGNNFRLSKINVQVFYNFLNEIATTLNEMNKLEKFMGKDMKYEPPSVMCPDIGFQKFEASFAKKYKKYYEVDGFCAFWSMLFAELCLLNPEFTGKEIIKKIYECLETHYEKNTLNSDDKWSSSNNSQFKDEKKNVLVSKYLRKLIIGYFKNMFSILNEKLKKHHGMTLDEIHDKGFKIFRDIHFDMESFFDKMFGEKRYKCRKNLCIIENKENKEKTCPEGKILNPLTNRCVKNKSKKPEVKTCPEGKTLNPLTNRCVKNKSKKPEVKTCPEGKILNPLTNRCIINPSKKTLKNKKNLS